MTNYSRLLEDKRIQREPAARAQVNQQLAACPAGSRDGARGLLAGEHEWAYTIAYNAMLLAWRAVTFSDGYRPATTGGHAAVVEFLRIRLGASCADAVQIIDRMRRQRHRIINDASGTSRPAKFARPF